MSYTRLSETERIARKQYLCIWCGEPIPKGSRYHWETGVHDGDFQMQRKHLECKRASTEVDWDSRDDGYEEFEFYRGTPISKGWTHELAEYLFPAAGITDKETTNADT